MNAKILVLLTSCIAVVMIHTTAMASMQQTSIQHTSGQGSYIRQSSIQTDPGQTNKFVITLDSAKVRQPQILSVSSPKNTQFTGEITVNGKVIEQLKNKKISLDLSRFLLLGKNTIEISGSYKPAKSLVKVEFSGPGNQVSQEIGGSGKLSQTLIVEVQ